MKNITLRMRNGCPSGHVRLEDTSCKKVTAHHTAQIQFWYPEDAQKAHEVLSNKKIMNFSAAPFTASLSINERMRCPHKNPLYVMDILRDAGIHIKEVYLTDKKGKIYYGRQFGL